MSENNTDSKKEIEMPAGTIRTISRVQARRAIYIDFESNPDWAPSILGVLYRKDSDRSDVFNQYILEKCLYPAGNFGTNKPIDEVVEEVLDMAERENRRILAWSTKEISDIEKYCSPDLHARARDLVTNAIPIAKRWRNVFHSHTPIPDQAYGGNHTQAHYMDLVGFHVPDIYGRGTASVPIRSMREELRSRNGNYDTVPFRVKNSWRHMLEHNKKDCEGLQRIMYTVSRDMARRNDAYNGQLFRRAG